MGPQMFLIGASIGLGAIKAANEMTAAKKTAKMTVAQGKLAAENKAKTVLATAARQKVSFLSSGLALEGTPMAVLSSTYETGKADINQIIQNANTSAKNTMSQARSSALGTILGGAMTGISAAGGMNSLTSLGSSLTEETAFSLNSMGYGNTAWNMLENT